MEDHTRGSENDLDEQVDGKGCVMCKLDPHKNVPPSPNILDCHCLYVCGSPPEELRKAEDTTLERAAQLHSLHTCFSFAC